jgi:hypothetical protein
MSGVAAYGAAVHTFAVGASAFALVGLAVVGVIAALRVSR